MSRDENKHKPNKKMTILLNEIKARTKVLRPFIKTQSLVKWLARGQEKVTRATGSQCYESVDSNKHIMGEAYTSGLKTQNRRCWRRMADDHRFEMAN